MALVKRFGQLVEDDSPTLKDKVDQFDLNQTPTSPFGAASVGASPDSAKMAGTPAQKLPVLKEAVQKEQTLAGQTRLQQPMQAQPADQQAQQKASQLKQLGTLSNRVQSKIEGMLQQAGQTAPQGQLQASDQALQLAMGLTPEQAAAQQPQLTQIKDKIAAYTAAPTEASLKELVDLGMPKAQVYQLTGLLETGEQATGRTIAEATANELKLSDIDVTEMGFGSLDDISQLLGQDASQMTVPQLQESVQKLQQAEFDKIEELRAQAAALPVSSARYQIIKRQLRELGDVGTTGTEQAATEAVKQIDMADTVTVGDQQFKVADLLKDDTISDVIQSYLAAPPERKDKMLPPEKFGQLRQWIENNQAALGIASSAAQAQQKAFETANTEWQAFSADTGINPEALTALGIPYDPTATVTSDQLAATKATFDATAIGQLAKDPANVPLMAAVTPDNAAMIKEWDAPTIKQSFETARNIVGDPVLQSLIGITGSDAPSFVDQQTMAQAQVLKPMADSLNKMPRGTELVQKPEFVQAIKDGHITQDWLQSKYEDALAHEEILPLITSGELTAADRDKMMENFGAKMRTYEDLKLKSEALAKAQSTGDINELLDTAIGADVDPEQLQEELERAKIAAELGDPKAQSAVDRYTKLLNPSSPEFSPTTTPLADMLKGTAGPPKRFGPSDLAPFQSQDANIDQLTRLSRDGITQEELQTLTPEALSKLYPEDGPPKLGAPPLQDAVEQLFNDTVTRAGAEDLLDLTWNWSRAGREKSVRTVLDMDLMTPEEIEAAKQQVKYTTQQLRASADLKKPSPIYDTLIKRIDEFEENAAKELKGQEQYGEMYKKAAKKKKDTEKAVATFTHKALMSTLDLKDRLQQASDKDKHKTQLAIDAYERFKKERPDFTRALVRFTEVTKALKRKPKNDIQRKQREEDQAAYDRLVKELSNIMNDKDNKKILKDAYII